jgi:hypothetical protein
MGGCPDGKLNPGLQLSFPYDLKIININSQYPAHQKIL